MKIAHSLRALLATITALVSLLVPQLAQAEHPNLTTPRIEGFNVEEVTRLAPGTELHFDIYGTPGGTAVLRIAGATRNLTLQESEPGQYEGTYTISTRDKIQARSPVTANLRVGNQVASMVLNESLVVGVGAHNRQNSHRAQSQRGTLPTIDRFSVEPTDDLSGGNDLEFSVFGTPGGRVDLTIRGVKGKIFLPEVASGEYATTYTIKNRDRITSNSLVTANLRVGERVASATLNHPLQTAGASTPAPVSRTCSNCGTVEAINRVEVKGDGTYLGTIGGGVAGALLGSQVGKGKGRTAAQIAGALGGAYAGHVIEGKVRKTYHYEVLVRLQNGTSQTLTFTTEPDYRVGEKVKINGGVITRDL